MVDPIHIASAAITGLAALAALIYGRQSPDAAPTKINEHLVKICQIHLRLKTAYPGQDIKTFFQHMGLDSDAAPFQGRAWLMPGEAAREQARDVIQKAWAEPVQRVLWGPLEEQHQKGLYSAVTEALLDHKIMQVYMETVMPKIGKAKEKNREAELRAICGDEWEGQ